MHIGGAFKMKPAVASHHNVCTVYGVQYTSLYSIPYSHKVRAMPTRMSMMYDE